MFRIALFLCGLAASHGAFRGRQAGTIESLDLTKALSDMQPEVVAKLLGQVEQRWKESRVSALRNQTDESEALAEMTKSCIKVAKAVIDGSEGDKNRVVEYMADVCEKGANKKGCDSFAAGIETTMTFDAEVNRNSLDLNKFCMAYWTTTVTVDATAEAHRLDAEEAAQKKEEAEQAEAQRKAQEEEASKKAEADAEKQESQDMEEAEKLQKTASDDDAQISSNAKSVEERITQAEDKATQLVDKARSALQLAAEKEAQAAEPAAAEPQAQEPKAEEPKVEVNASSVEAAAPSDQAPVEDEKAAEAAGDALAEKIANKALAKDASPTEVTDKPKEAEAPQKAPEATKLVEVAKKF